MNSGEYTSCRPSKYNCKDCLNLHNCLVGQIAVINNIGA